MPNIVKGELKSACMHKGKEAKQLRVHKDIKACGIPVDNCMHCKSTEAIHSHQINPLFTARHFNLFP